MNKWLVIFSLCFSMAFAHDGHDHSSSAASPQKGGIMRTLEEIHLEVVPEGKRVKIYVYKKDEKLTPAEANDYPVSAIIKLPREKQPKPIKLTMGKHHWDYEFDAKGAHRYKLELMIQQGGHQDKVSWNIEPRPVE